MKKLLKISVMTCICVLLNTAPAFAQSTDTAQSTKPPVTKHLKKHRIIKKPQESAKNSQVCLSCIGHEE